MEDSSTFNEADGMVRLVHTSDGLLTVAPDMRCAELVYTKEETKPTKATAHSAGYDVKCSLGYPVTLKAQKMLMLPTGVFLKQMAPVSRALLLGRSGLAANHSILAHVGLVDPDFDRNKELQIMLFNLGSSNYKIEKYERIGQLKFENTAHVVLTKESHEMRRERHRRCQSDGKHHSGFGSTGRL